MCFNFIVHVRSLLEGAAPKNGAARLSEFATGAAPMNGVAASTNSHQRRRPVGCWRMRGWVLRVQSSKGGCYGLLHRAPAEADRMLVGTDCGRPKTHPSSARPGPVGLQGRGHGRSCRSRRRTSARRRSKRTALPARSPRPARFVWSAARNTHPRRGRRAACPGKSAVRPESARQCNAPTVPAQCPHSARCKFTQCPQLLSLKGWRGWGHFFLKKEICGHCVNLQRALSGH